MFTALQLATDNYQGHLDRALTTINSGRDDPEAYFLAAWSWRVLGICQLLGEANVDTFSDFFVRSGQSRLAFLRKVRDGLSCDPKFLCASKDLAFTAAVAAGDLSTARHIALTSPTSHFDGIEYEDDFLFFHLLHRLAAAPDDAPAHQALIARWKDVLEGNESGVFAACRGLVNGSGQDFTAGFAAMLTNHAKTLGEYRESPAFDEQLFSAEGQIYVEALAVLRFAELRGLPTELEYPLVPSIARVPLRDTPLAPDAWRIPPV